MAHQNGKTISVAPTETANLVCGNSTSACLTIKPHEQDYRLRPQMSFRMGRPPLQIQILVVCGYTSVANALIHGQDPIIDLLMDGLTKTRLLEAQKPGFVSCSPNDRFWCGLGVSSCLKLWQNCPRYWVHFTWQSSHRWSRWD